VQQSRFDSLTASRILIWVGVALLIALAIVFLVDRFELVKISVKVISDVSFWLSFLGLLCLVLAGLIRAVHKFGLK